MSTASDSTVVQLAGWSEKSGSAPDEPPEEELSPPDQLVPLLEAAGRGDQQAFAELYNAAAPKLYAIALRILKQEGQAQECLQDGLVRIWEHAADYRPERGAPMTWMGIIVRRRALDMIRRSGRERVGNEAEDVERWLDGRALAGPGEDPVDPVERDKLLACLAELRPEQQQVLRWAYFEGLTHPEMAERSQVPLGTVKTWIRRGIARLRDCLEP